MTPTEIRARAAGMLAALADAAGGEAGRNPYHGAGHFGGGGHGGCDHDLAALWVDGYSAQALGVAS